MANAFAQFVNTPSPPAPDQAPQPTETSTNPFAQFAAPAAAAPPAMIDPASVHQLVQSNQAAHPSPAEGENPQPASFQDKMDAGAGFPISKTLNPPSQGTAPVPVSNATNAHYLDAVNNGTCSGPADYCQQIANTVAHAVDPQPGGAAQPWVDSIAQGVGTGLQQVAEKVKQTGQAVSGQTPSPTSILSPDDAHKLAGITAAATSQYPEMAAALIGGKIGLMAPGAWKAIAAPVGAAVGAGLTHMAINIAPMYANNLKQTNNDADKAWDLTKKNISTESSFTGLSFAAFEASPFAGILKNVVSKIAAQSVISATQKAGQNISTGQPLMQGTGQVAQDAALTNFLLLGGHEAVNVGTHALITGPELHPALKSLVASKLGVPESSVTPEVADKAFANSGNATGMVPPEHFSDVSKAMFGDDSGVTGLQAVNRAARVPPVQIFDDAQHDPTIATDIAAGKIPAAYADKVDVPQEEAPTGRFHGTSSEIPSLSEYTYALKNIYGQGFYTTDNYKISQGYSKKGGGDTPTIYHVNEKSPLNIYDLEKPVSESPEVSSMLDDISKHDHNLGTAIEIAKEDYGNKLTLRHVYDELRNTPDVSADTLQESMDSIQYSLEKLGYHGIEHVGGKFTGKDPHNVKIYFNPARDLNIEKVGGRKQVPSIADLQSKAEQAFPGATSTEMKPEDWEALENEWKQAENAANMESVSKNGEQPANVTEGQGTGAEVNGSGGAGAASGGSAGGGAAGGGSGGDRGGDGPVGGSSPEKDEPSKLSKAIKGIRDTFSPTSAGGKAKETEAAIRGSYGQAKRNQVKAESSIGKFAKQANKLVGDKLKDFYNYVENRSKGAVLGNKEFQGMADAIRKVYGDFKDTLQKMPETHAMNFVTDYFNHQWKPGQEEKLKQFIDSWWQQGSGKNLKERNIPTIQDGINFGLELEEPNPVRAISRYIGSMSNYIASVDLLRTIHTELGGEYYADGKQPEGYVPLVGRNAERVGSESVSIDPESMDVNHGSLYAINSKTGKYFPANIQRLYAPKEVADLYNAFYSKGFEDTKLKETYELARNAINTNTLMELGLSAYHFSTINVQSMNQDVSRILKNVTQGDWVGVGKAITGLLTPGLHTIRGTQLLNQYKGLADHGVDMEKIANLFAGTNQRVGLDPLQNVSHGGFYKSWQRGELPDAVEKLKSQLTQGYGLGAVKSAADVVQKIVSDFSHPLFGAYVPAMKMAGFHDLMGDWLRQNPDATTEETTKASIWISNLVESRFGEKNMENIFWNTKAKQVAGLAARAPGWDMGIGEQALGPVSDIYHMAKGAKNGEKFDPQRLDRLLYLAGLGIVAAAINSGMTYLHTGIAPDKQNLLDFLNYRTGGTHTTFGKSEPERAEIPGHLRELQQMAPIPGEGEFSGVAQEIKNKESSLPSHIEQDIMAAPNTKGQYKDNFGNVIYDPNSTSIIQRTPGVAQAAYIAKGYAPFMMDQLLSGQQPGSNLSFAERFMGIRPSGARIVDPQDLAKFNEHRN